LISVSYQKSSKTLKLGQTPYMTQFLALNNFATHTVPYSGLHPSIHPSIHSPKGLLRTPVQFLIKAIIQSTNHMAVDSIYLGPWSWSRQSPELQTECQNEGKVI